MSTVIPLRRARPALTRLAAGRAITCPRRRRHHRARLLIASELRALARLLIGATLYGATMALCFAILFVLGGAA